MKFNYALSALTACLLLTSNNHAANTGSIVLGETKSISVPPSVTQTSFEFYLDRTGVDDGVPLSVGNFQVRVDLSGPGAGTAVRVVGVGETASHLQAYALDTKSVTAGTSAFAATLNLLSPFDIPDGGGLLKLDLELQPGTVGNYALAVRSGPGHTEFTSPIDFSTLIPIDVGMGLLAVVPEPATLLMFAMAAAHFGINGRYRRER
jgi:hypothetical protein